jgi:hypothetical protein
MMQPNRDLVVFHGQPVVRSAARRSAPLPATAANEAVGAQSRLAGSGAAAIVLVLLLLFLHRIERIPQPVLAAIVIHAVSKSLRLSVFRDYFRWQRSPGQTAQLAVPALACSTDCSLRPRLAMLPRVGKSPAAVLGRVGEHDYVSVSRYPNATSVNTCWYCGRRSCSSPTPIRCWQWHANRC